MSKINNKYKQTFKNSGFIVFNKFIKKNTMDSLVEKTIYLKKNVVVWETPQDDGGNLFVTNKKRRAYILYLDQNNLAEVLPVNIVDKAKKFPPFLQKRINSYDKCYDTLVPIIKPQINTMLRILGYRKWAIVGITLFSIAPGSPEQEIHHDAPEETKRLFLTIPLHDTPINMGPTVFYDDRLLGDFRDRYMNNVDDRVNRPYGNIGFLNEIKEKELFNKARCQFNHDRGDVVLHRDITWHSAGNNLSKKHREILFIVIDVTHNI